MSVYHHVVPCCRAAFCSYIPNSVRAFQLSPHIETKVSLCVLRVSSAIPLPALTYCSLSVMTSSFLLMSHLPRCYHVHLQSNCFLELTVVSLLDSSSSLACSTKLRLTTPSTNCQHPKTHDTAFQLKVIAAFYAYIFSYVIIDSLTDTRCPMQPNDCPGYIPLCMESDQEGSGEHISQMSPQRNFDHCWIYVQQRLAFAEYDGDK